MLAGRSRFTLDVGIAHRCARDERLEDERLEDERLEDEASHLDGTMSCVASVDICGVNHRAQLLLELGKRILRVAGEGEDVTQHSRQPSSHQK